MSKSEKISQVLNESNTDLNLHEIKAKTGAGNGFKHHTSTSKSSLINNTNKSKKIYDIVTNIEGKIKSIFNKENNIFIFRNNYKNDNNIKDKEKWSLKRHKALERAKYKCEECGSITNLEVYTKEFNNNEELIVLCKMCYEKNIGEMKLHCQ